MSVIEDGTRVRLLRNPAEGWEEESGEVEGYEGDGTYVVRLDEEYLTNCFDDGLREVHESVLEVVE